MPLRHNVGPAGGMNLTRLVLDRAGAGVGGEKFRQELVHWMTSSTSLASHVEVDSAAHTAAVTALDIDEEEGR